MENCLHSGTRVIFYSRERWYRAYRKVCLGIIYGCEKFHAYFKHKDFELHCCCLALCWLLKRIKNGVIHWGEFCTWPTLISRPKHVCGVKNVLVDALSWVFEGNYKTEPKIVYVALLQILPLFYSSTIRAPEIKSWLYGYFGENLDK
jgi:hypothetical protein